MNANKNARTTPYNRALIVRWVLYEGEAVKDVAPAKIANISLRQVFAFLGGADRRQER